MTTRQPHVLVVDEPIILELMHDLLEEEGFRVSTCGDLLPDLDEIKDLQPNLLVTDFLRAGQVSGWSWIRRLKSDPHLRAIPVVLCTDATSDAEALASCLAEMDVAVVGKPFDIDVLLNVVRSALCPFVAARA